MDHATMGEAFKDPNADRQWVSYGLVTDDASGQRSVLFDDGEGQALPYPMVMVTLQPSGIVVPCRVAGQVAGDGEGEWYPFVAGDEVLVVIPEGNERAGCVIIGRLNQKLDRWPRQVAGQDATKNTFGFRRMIAPYILETKGGFLIRSAVTKAFMGIDPQGQLTLANGDGGALHLGADFLGLATGDNAVMVQLDPAKSTLFLQADQAQLLMTSGDTSFLTPGRLVVGTAGVGPNGHACTIEQVVNLLDKALALLPTAGYTPANLNAAIAAAAAGGGSIALFAAALTAALAVTPNDPTGAAPGVGKPGILF